MTEFKLSDDFEMLFNNEVVFEGKSVLIEDAVKDLPKKKYEVEIKTKDGKTITRQTNFIDYDEKNDKLIIDGAEMTGVTFL